MNFPEILEEPDIGGKYPSDVIDRARKILASIPSGVGAYSESKGNSRELRPCIHCAVIALATGVGALRQTVADFIEKRDGHTSDPESIFLTDGASPAVQMCMNAMITKKSDAIMVPLPQYPWVGGPLRISFVVLQLQTAFDQKLSHYFMG